MMQLHNFIRTSVLVCVVALAAAPAYALHPVPNLPSCDPAPTGAPIDGGASLLLASGAAYAVRHLRKRKSQR